MSILLHNFQLSLDSLLLLNHRFQLQLILPLNQTRQRIEVRDLPKNIKTALQRQDNVDIATTAAYESQMNDPKDLQTPNKEIYFVDLKYSAHTVTAISDKDGNRLDKIKPDDQK
jgi:hypothetical protein